MIKAILIAVVGLLAVVVTWSFYSAVFPEIHPDVILISLDTLRSDYLGCYGNPNVRTPAIDHMSLTGMIYSDHQANSNWTLPSHVSMFTSKYASDHRIVYENRKMPDEVVTLTEEYKKHGYQTAGFHSICYLNDSTNFPQGFDSYSEYDWVHGSDWSKIAACLKPSRETPLFLFLHSFEAHAPYGGYKEYQKANCCNYLETFDEFEVTVEQLRNNYISRDWNMYRSASLQMILGFLKGEDRYSESINARLEKMRQTQVEFWEGMETLDILNATDPWYQSDCMPQDIIAMKDNYIERVNHCDSAVHDLLKLISNNERLDKTIICLTSDHGESFYERGNFFGHGGSGKTYLDPYLTADTSFYHDLVSVPMIIWSQDDSLNRRIEPGLTSSLDIYPTLLSLTGFQVDHGSVSGSDVSKTVADNRYVVIENQRTMKRAVVSSSWKMIISDDNREMYYRELDPAERSNLGDGPSSEIFKMTEFFNAWKQNRELRFYPDGQVTDSETRRKLQMMGYLIQ